MCEVIPSPGTEEKDWAAMEKRLELVVPFVKTIHIDVIDGKFAPNTTFSDPKPFKKFTDQVLFEVHLMVEEPINYIQPFADAGFKRFIGQIEKMSDQAAFVAEAQLLGEAVLAVDGKTPLEKLQVPNYEDLDGLLVMTINAGFSGQSFMSELLEKVKAIRSKGIYTPEGEPFPIEVDGGINDQTIKLAKEAGANRFVATSFLFKGDPKAQYSILHDLVKE